MKTKSLRTVLLLIAIVSCLLIPSNVSAGKVKKTHIMVYKMTGRTIKYKKIIGYWEDAPDVPKAGGKMKKITCSKNCKYYWYKTDVNKHSKISKKKFTKRINYYYNVWQHDFMRGPGNKLVKNSFQYCTVWIKNKKIIKIFGEYLP